MRRHGSVRIAAGVALVLVCACVTGLMAQQERKTPADEIGKLSDKAAQAFAKPVKLVEEEWPNNVPKLGPFLDLGDDVTMQLPSSFKMMRVATRFKMVGITFVDEGRPSRLRVFFGGREALFVTLFDLQSRLKDVITQRELEALKPKIGAFDQQSDEKKFTEALSATTSAYYAAEDYFTAAKLRNALRFRKITGMDKDVSVRKIPTGGNTIYASSNYASSPDWALWVFDKKKLFLGKIICSKQDFLLALAIARSMHQEPDLGISDQWRREQKFEPYKVPQKDPNRIKKIALGIYLFHDLYRKLPDSLQDLKDRKVVEKDAKIETLNYLRPTTSFEEWNDDPPVMLYPKFEAWPKGGIWIGFADGVVKKVETEDEFKEIMEYRNKVRD